MLIPKVLLPLKCTKKTYFQQRREIVGEGLGMHLLVGEVHALNNDHKENNKQPFVLYIFVNIIGILALFQWNLLNQV